MTWDLRLGRWQDVLADVGDVDAVITDTPFSQRTAEGFRGGDQRLGTATIGIPYGHINVADVADVVASWVPRTKWWFVVFGDHILASEWAVQLEAAGLYVFAPVPWVKADGP